VRLSHFGRPFAKRFALCYRTVVCPDCLDGREMLVYCGRGWMDQMKLGMAVGLGHGHIVLDGNPAPLPQKGHTPHFGHVYCGQSVRWITMSLGMEVGLGQGDIVLHGDLTPSPTKRRGHSTPNFGPSK